MGAKRAGSGGGRWIVLAVVLLAAGAAVLGRALWGADAGRTRAVGPAGSTEEPARDPAEDLTPATAVPTPTVEAPGEAATPDASERTDADAPAPDLATRRERTTSSVLVRVRDGAGAAMPDVALRLHGAHEDFGITDGDGRLRFRFPAAVEGDVVLELVSGAPDHVVRPRRTKLRGPHPAERRVELTATPWPPPVAGDVAGTLVSETGSWPDARFFEEPGTLILELVTHVEWDPTAHEDPPPRVERRATLEPVERDDGSRALAFRFPDVPEGSYELTLSTLDPYPWSATSLFVEPPATTLELVRYDAAETRTLGFRVLDAATGDAIEDFEAWRIEQSISATNGVFLHAGPFPTEAVPLSGPLRWSLHADGYAPAFGDERAFDTETEDGRVVATVRLERGWSAWLCVMGPQPSIAPLVDVQVSFGGTWQRGRTDGSGMLVVHADEVPTEVEFDLRGWRVKRGAFEALDSLAARRRGFVAPFVLVPE